VKTHLSQNQNGTTTDRNKDQLSGIATTENNRKKAI